MPNLVGIGLSQVPTNSMLGGLAYQDPEHASIKDLDLKNLSQINSEIADTAVDIFVYDTRKDSDGGAWRKRTQHTSWYNETLGTATRGTRREFPAVAVIVAEANTLTIYDGDDPDLPMWMVFNTTSGNLIGAGALRGVTALNGIIVTPAAGYTMETRFISDYSLDWFVNQLYEYKGNIEQRHDTLGFRLIESYGLVNSASNDAAMTVLPNAPIDDTTGLPVPTIAVATNAGVSIIKDDGTVVDITASGYTATDNKIDFDHLNNVLYLESGGFPQRQSIPSSDIIRSATGGRDRVYGGTSSYVPSILGTSSNIVTNSDGFATGSTSGLSILDYDSSQSQEMVAYATTSYNTGYMQGDIKGAFLSDTDDTNITGGNIVTNGDAWTGAQSSTSTTPPNGWTGGNAAQWRTSTGGDGSYIRLVNAGSSQGGPNSYMYQAITTVPGRKYKISLTQYHHATISVYYYVGTSINGNQLTSGTWVSSSSNTPRNEQNTFTATGTTTYLTLGITSGTNNYDTGWDNVVITEVVDDRSVNVNGLHSYGTITKSAVATGAELVSYSGWSSSNYLIQPYNSGLDFGTGNWSYMFWYNPNDAESGDVIFSRWSYNVDSNQGPRVTAYFNSGNLRVDTADASAGSGYQGHFGSDGTQDSNEWHCAVILRRGPNLEIWIDGVNYKNATLNSTSDGNYTDTNSILEIGHSPNSGAPEAGLELALFRVSATVPSPEQIKKMYEDEKVLFQENAKATLYGSSDAVTALGYDEDTELLHVGTSSGRSDFQGLRRINNTTTAVTTAISASDDLIAEQ